MKILIDMSLSPSWVEFFASHRVESEHWSRLGNPKAADPEIMDYARANGLVVFTHDLDFGNILAVTHARGPSVIQARVEDPVPSVIGNAILAALDQCRAHLDRGALVTIDPDRSRTRILPIVPGIKTEE